MKKDWKEYNNHLVKRGELLIDAGAFGLEEKYKQEKKRGRPYTYPEPLIRKLLQTDPEIVFKVAIVNMFLMGYGS